MNGPGLRQNMAITIEQGRSEPIMLEAVEKFGDYIQPFQIEGLGLQGRLVRLGEALDQAFERHAYPEPVSALLGETMALAAALSGSIKYDGIFTLQIQGDGPVGLLMSDLTSGGDLRGYVRFDNDKLASALARDGAEVPKLVGTGHMAFTVDQGPDTERYQGVVALEGGKLADCAQTYFRQSEQLETALVVAVDTAKQPGSRSAALMIQRLPGQTEGSFAHDEEDDAWRRAVVLMSSVRPEELLDANLSSSQLLYRLYHEDGVRMYSARPLRQACRCSEEKIKRTLAAFPKDEIAEMVEDGNVSVICEFCKSEYVFPLDGVG